MYILTSISSSHDFHSLFHGVVLLNQMSCPAVSPNDRIADVDFFDVLQAVDASIEASQRVEMFAANVQEGRNTISRLRLGHYLRKTGLLSSRGFPKASEQVRVHAILFFNAISSSTVALSQRAGPYRSTDADDTVQLKFALECVQGGLDAALSGIQVRASAGTMEPTIDWSSDIAMIARIQSRMKQVV